jgi:hypothetical protein
MTHMSNSEPPYLLFLLPFVALAVGVGYLAWWPSYSRSILQRWASAKHFELLQFRRCFLHGGFSWWRTSYKQMVFFVKVRDDSGHERTGWVKFGRFFWGGEYSSLEPEVIWSEHEAKAA